jgi:hypothetical protein
MGLPAVVVSENVKASKSVGNKRALDSYPSSPITPVMLAVFSILARTVGPVLVTALIQSKSGAMSRRNRQITIEVRFEFK